MVLSERSINGPSNRVHNQARNSPSNGHVMEEESSSSSDEDTEHGMRVGNEYQAIIPDISSVMTKPAPEYEPEHAVLIWSPTNNIPDDELEAYIQLAKEKYNYCIEQALGMLCWHKYNIEPALADLANFTPLPDEWTVEDRVLFEQAYQFHEKHFHKIKQMLPDKSIANLVKYYYTWKRTRTRTSLMDRQARRFNNQKDDGSDAPSDGSGDENPEERDQSKPRCENCSTTASGQFHNTSKGVFCRACYSFWRRTGMMRNAAIRKHEPGSTRHNPMKSKRKPPRGMFINLDDLMTIVNGPQGQGDAILRGLDSEISNLKRSIQNLKPIVNGLRTKTADLNNFKRIDPPQRINARWTAEESLLAVQGVRRHGKDFKAIAEIVGTKTEVHVGSFYINNEKRYALDTILKEHEDENGIEEKKKEEES